MSYIGNQPTNVAFVTDTFNGTGSTTAFTMSVAPASTSSIIVAVTGVLQDPSTYSVSGTTLTFSAAPPSGTGNISVRYLGIPASGVTTTAYRTQTEFTATAGQTSFSVPSYTVGYIDVYRNGAKLGTADFTASTGTTVVLASACNAGDLVQTVSFYVSSVLNAIPATAGAVNSTYIATGAVGTAQIASSPTITSPTLTSPTISGTTTWPDGTTQGGYSAGTVTATAFPSGFSAQTINYTNSTNRIVFFNSYGSGSAGTTIFTLSVNGVTVGYTTFGAGTAGSSVFAAIPPGKSASLVISGNNFSAGQYVITA